MAHREKKRKRTETQRFDYLEKKKSFSDEMKSFFHFSKSYHLVKNIKKKKDTILKVFGKSFLIITVVKCFVLMSGHGFGLVKYYWGMDPMFDFLFFFFGRKL